MLTIDRKLLRDLRQLKGQALAIGLVIAAGVAMFTMYFSTFESLDHTHATYYDRYRFADVFASLKRAPLATVSRIEALPGVARVEPRVVVQATLDVAGMTEPAVGQLLSIPEHRRAILNDVYLVKGRYIQPGRPDEVLVIEAFALAHGLEPGDRVGAIINGRRRELQIVGVALSPEFVYTIAPGDLLPDDRRFGVFWMGRRALASAFDMEGGFNDLALTLTPSASSEQVIADVDRVLRRYGGLGAIPRRLQVSAWFVANEMREMQTMGSILPVVFLAVAAFLLNVVLSRIISVQRTQIAALKAVGYSNGAVALHYTKLGLVIALAGGLIGVAVGAWLGRGLTSMYSQWFRFPSFEYFLSSRIALAALAVSVTAAALGAFGAVRRAVSLPPAEAMRPEPPASFKRSWLERIGLARFLSEPARMILRNLGRRPVRTLLSATGIAFAIALLVFGFFFVDAIDLLMKVQFEEVMLHDVTTTFVEPTSSAARHEVERMPGVLYTEPFRAVPARLRHGSRSRQAAILGLPATPRLNRVVGQTAGAVELPPAGLVLSSTLGRALGVEVGDRMTVEILEGSRPTRTVPVSLLVDEVMGISAYMEIGALRRMMREGSVLSGAFLKVDPAEIDRLHERLKATPRVAGVSLTTAAYQSFQNTIGQTLGLMITINLIFAAVIACGVVYNSARISLSERERDLASLRVLGFTRAEISFILLGELAVVTLLAIPLGLVLGYGFCRGIIEALASELLRIPMVADPVSYAWSAVAVAAVSALSGLAVRRRLDRLDLVAVLKSRE
ncbi:MAG: FtsX-like permease family protein [bacterium]|nr:FtsX-like permease family protein [bacterium]